MSNTLRVKVRERWYTVEVEDLGLDPVKTLVDGAPVEVHIEATGADSLPAAPVESPPEETSQDEIVAPAPARATATRAMASPMPGVIVSVAVQVGDQLVTGDEVCVLEAMKMQQVLRADWTGIVAAVHVGPGQQVADGDPIIELG